ncbi:MAG: cupin domain-containing protein [Burkholderiaceae bacterium]|nr:cupin domain-containing protein [Burkholderiaceae bacterium]
MSHKKTHPSQPMSTQPRSALRANLLQRVQRSHAHESQFVTVRRDANAWRIVLPGLRTRELAQTEVARSSLVELAAGASVPQSPQFTQAELVLLSGEALLGPERLTAGDAALAPHDAAHTLSAGAAGAVLYLRLSAPAKPSTQTLRFSTLTDDASWEDFGPGVRIKMLYDGGERSSIVVRMYAGAQVNAHSHGLEEECMMLGGEAFIGDTLLRSGEYQLAPQGSRHGKLTTDVGGLFYVHGSLDPAAYA